MGAELDTEYIQAEIQALLIALDYADDPAEIKYIGQELEAFKIALEYA